MPTAHDAAQDKESQQTTSTVSKKDNEIIYIGSLTAEANEKVRGLIDDETKTLRISSVGGDINLGMDLGDLVFSHNLNVEILDYCFSSCANYVFPAGRTKFINKRSMLGWHGGAFQKMEFTDAEMRKLYLEYSGPAQSRETSFFDKIGVSGAITTIGQHDQYSAYAQCAGWTYSLDMLAALGVRNIILLDGIWSPATHFNGKCIFQIERIIPEGG